MLKPTRNRRFSTAALIAVAILAFLIAGEGRADDHFGAIARATSKVEKTVHEFNKDVGSWIERFRRGDMPEGIAKSNGRIEATEIDVSSKYAGRLETVMVNDGDDVKAGQVIARISSPEYEAQLRTAQANVLVASNTLAAAEAKVAQAQADLVYAKGDLERGKALVNKGWLTRQTYDQRVDRVDTDKAAVDAAEKQRDAAKSVVGAAQAEVEIGRAHV